MALLETIPSRPADAESVCLKMRELLEANGLGGVCFAVELLARECVNNAVIHGNRNDADKSIQVSLRLGRKWIRLEVSDEGPGFDWRTKQQNRMDTAASSGRGLHLYAMYAERVRFNRRGNRITLWIGRRD
jgi:serine/threonine-protein kinase RsbW